MSRRRTSKHKSNNIPQNNQFSVASVFFFFFFFFFFFTIFHQLPKCSLLRPRVFSYATVVETMLISFLLLLRLASICAAAAAASAVQETHGGWRMGLRPRQEGQNIQPFAGALGGIQAPAVRLSFFPFFFSLSSFFSPSIGLLCSYDADREGRYLTRETRRGHSRSKTTHL